MESNRLTNLILDGEYDAFHWNWYMEPDPDSILDVFTCDQRGDWSDSWYCNEEYDALDVAQNREVDDDKRVEMIKEMQQILFEESPYLVTAYTATGQAFRSDRFACFVPQPREDGVLLVQYGGYNYTHLRPVEEAGDCDGVAGSIGASQPQAAASSDDDDSNAAMLIGGAAVVAVLLAGGGLMVFRRRATAGDRE
jgi:peptide/nickel transport system substrate-binding protein